MQSNKIINLSLLVLVLISVGNFRPLFSVTLEEDADQLYQQAYNLILDKKWQAASDLFQTLIDQYPQSNWVDDARFWKCFATEKLQSSLEKAYQCYEGFIEKYPASKWVKDAKTNMLRLAQELAQQGKTEYQTLAAAFQTDENDEIAMAALFALQHRGDARAYTALESIFDKTTDVKRRKKMIYMFGTFDSPQSQQKLLTIAQKDQNTELRSEAMFWLGQQHPTKETTEFLKDRVYHDPDAAVQKKALFSLSQIEGATTTQFLIEIAKKHPDQQIREEAIFWIGQKAPADQALAALQDFALNDASEAIQNKAIFSLSQISKEKALPVLMKIAKDKAKPNLREQAIFWISQTDDSPEVVNFLKDLVDQDPDLKIQKKALFALTQLHDSATEKELLKIAKTHKSIEVREEAIFWLGQAATTSEIIQAIRDLALNAAEPEVQEKAVFALSQAPDNKGLPYLIEIARKHKNTATRKKAIFWLGQSNDEAAMKAIEEILYEKK